jgi:saccharopine dehydrogenase-like NADP-dependent oxidoreductase
MMQPQKHIALFGAGKSASVLIEYLKTLSSEKKWLLTVVDNNADNVQQKVGEHEFATAVAINIEDEIKRSEIIAKADIVISLLPADLHYRIAIDCLRFNKNLLTASYTDEKIKLLSDEIKAKGLLFICEMGLDPGIDHMSAMKLINEIHAKNGKIISFKSHCGGLVAPESDDNPWHYKISWNPRNVVLAGKAGAVYRLEGKEIFIDYKNLFTSSNHLPISKDQTLSWYANRDSLSYIDVYQLQHVQTFIRTTLRHPHFIFGWKNIVDLNLTDEEKKYDTNGMSIAAFFKTHLQEHGFKDWFNDMLQSRFAHAKDTMEKLLELFKAEDDEDVTDDFLMVNEQGELAIVNSDEVQNKATQSVAAKMQEANIIIDQLIFLGLNDETLINKGLCSAADIMQMILEKKLALKATDKDMIIMVHEIEYAIKNSLHKTTSTLIAKGADAVHTAMAKTVGLPLGIAAKLILEETITETGLHIPVIPAIYEPVLKQLALYGISFIDDTHKL